MVLFIAYAFLILWLVAKHRRRWLGLLWLGAGLAGIVGFGYLHFMLAVWTNGFVSLPLLQAMLYPYAGFIMFLALFIFCLPRNVEPHVCRACEYDLTGQEEAPALCPECGLSHRAEVHPSDFCAGCGGFLREKGRRGCICDPSADPAPPSEEEAQERARRRRRAAAAIASSRVSP